MYATMYAMGMVRKQVYIEARHDRLLKERAREYEVTEAELIRRAIERGLGRPSPAAPDPAAWRAVERYIARRRRGGAAARRRRWTREDLHDR